MFISLLLTLSQAFALVSPFPSTVENLNIPNSHIVESENGTLIRGMRPRTDKDISELLNLGVNNVLIFKDSALKDTSTEDEMNKLTLGGMSRKNIKVIPFKWKEIESFETACLQTIQALKLMREISLKNEKLFFHCTVGEDRTGYLAAMYKILFQDLTPIRAWDEEMCENGYANGNPRKPAHVAATVHKNVSIVYQKMIHKIQNGYLSAENLDESECSFDPARSKLFKPDNRFKECKKPSSKYDPTIE